MTDPTVLITGAGRGLGLEFVRQYADDGWRILACARRPSAAAELAELAESSGGRITVHTLDVADHATIESLARELQDASIDVLLNVAGTMGGQDFAVKGLAAGAFGAIDYDDWLQTIRVNVLGPMKVIECFVDQVARSDQKKVVTLSSVVGSMARNRSGGLYAYRSSKAAVNAMMKSVAIDLAPRGIIALPLHPGWVRTAMGGPRADIDAPTSVAGLRRVIAGLTPADAGRFLQYDGQELPW